MKIDYWDPQHEPTLHTWFVERNLITTKNNYNQSTYKTWTTYNICIIVCEIHKKLQDCNVKNMRQKINIK